MNTETIITSNPKDLFEFSKVMSEKYPNEKFWNSMLNKSMRYEQCVQSLRRTLNELKREAERDIDQMDQGFSPWSLSISSNADKVAELRAELKNLESTLVDYLYILEVSEDDKVLFWNIAQSTIKNENWKG